MSARKIALAPLALAASVLLLSCATNAPAEDPPPPASAPPPPAPPTPAEAPGPGDAIESRWRAMAAKIDATSSVDRFVQASALFLGTTYHNGPLGEGEFGGPDPDPRVDLDRVDCVTFLEQSLALALGPSRAPAGGAAGAGGDVTYLATLDRIRYLDGKVGFAERNHYMSIDWIPANTWLVEDVTEKAAPGTVRDVTRTIDRAKFLSDKGVTPRVGFDDAQTVMRAVIPRAAAAAAAPAIQSGDLIFWAGKNDGIVFVHTGMAARDAQGTLLFRHASSKYGCVVEEPLVDYAAGAGFTFGFAVLRLRPTAESAFAAMAGSAAPVEGAAAEGATADPGTTP